MNIDNLGQQGPAPQPAERSCRRHIQFKDGRRRRMATTRSGQEDHSAAADGSSSYENEICSKKKRAVIPKDGVSVIPRGDDVIKDLEVQARGSGVACRSYGKISVIGRRRQMEDSVATELGFLERGDKNYDFFGVYDGHGGCRVAEACGEVLHKLLAQIAEEEMGSSTAGEEDIDWEKVMTEGFQKMDAEVNKNGAAVATMGSTAVVVVVGDDKLVVANCGDSRAVLSRGGEAIQLSDDHKPDRPDELKRIEVSGGKVLNWNGQRVLGVLATSRSIGDYYLKPYVATEPEVRVISRSQVDECLILASDGLWDVISNELACQVARRCFDGRLRRNNSCRHFPLIGSDGSCSSNYDGSGKNESDDIDAAEAAALLAELALARGSRDNISVVVVRLKAASNSGRRNSPPPPSVS